MNIFKKSLLVGALAAGSVVAQEPQLLVQATEAGKIPLLANVLQCKVDECKHLAVVVGNAAVDTTGFRVTIRFKDPQGVSTSLIIDRGFTRLPGMDFPNFINFWKVPAENVYGVQVEEVKNGRSASATRQ